MIWRGSSSDKDAPEKLLSRNSRRFRQRKTKFAQMAVRDTPHLQIPILLYSKIVWTLHAVIDRNRERGVYVAERRQG